MNPSLLGTDGIELHTQQGVLISLNIYYFGAICLQLQTVKLLSTPTLPLSAQGAFLGRL